MLSETQIDFQAMVERTLELTDSVPFEDSDDDSSDGDSRHDIIKTFFQR